jgi:hypothetical protein
MTRTEIEIAGALHDQLSESIGRRLSIVPSSQLDPDCDYLIVARVFGLSIKIWADEHLAARHRRLLSTCSHVSGLFSNGEVTSIAMQPLWPLALM